MLIKLGGWSCYRLLQAHGGRPPAHRMVLLVLKRIQGGMGRFCLAFLASFFLMRNSFWDGCSRRQRGGGRRLDAGVEPAGCPRAPRWLPGTPAQLPARAARSRAPPAAPAP